MASNSKCGNEGLHACEYVLDCLRYYSLGSGHRYFLAEAAGDIAEDGTDTRIACTELTLRYELTNREIAREAMQYIIRHPRRGGWEYMGKRVTVKADEAEIKEHDGIAIARGAEPKVKGAVGAHVGWIVEQYGKLLAAKLITIQPPLSANTWYSLAEAEEILRKESEDEEKRDRENTGEGSEE